jgi:SpoVK/Ycf46/Vps4 family AAA+-type ATPase
MTLADDVNLEEFVMTKDEFSGADIKAICTEAGLLALRERRMKVRLNVLFRFNTFNLFFGVYKYPMRASSHLVFNNIKLTLFLKKKTKQIGTMLRPYCLLL